MSGDGPSAANWRRLAHLAEVPVLIVVGLIFLPYWIYEDLVKFEESDRDD